MLMRSRKNFHYLSSYDVDRLLAGFRENQGLETKAEKYPGWEIQKFGAYARSFFDGVIAPQAYSNTKDPWMLEKLSYMASELSRQTPICNGYLSAFPETLIEHIEKKQPAWVPWYTMHKIIAGLFRYLSRCTNPKLHLTLL